MINILNFIFLIISTTLSILTYRKICIDSNNKSKKNLSIKTNNFELNSNTYNIILASITILAIIIRIWKFGLIPGGFNQDGAMAAVDGYALSKYATDRFGTFLPSHLYAWGYGQMSSLLSYLIALFVKIWGLSPIIARLPQLLVSLMGGYFFYLLIKDLFGKNMALIAAFFIAINPWHFMQSRWILDCNLLPHFFIAGVYFFNKGLINKKIYIYISMIFFALCMYCYGITIYTIPIFLLALAIYYYIKKYITIKDILISITIYLSISWPFILTMMVNFFKWKTIELPFVTIQYFKESIRSSDILFFSNNIGKQLINNIFSLLNVTLLQRKDLPWNDITCFGTMYLFTMPFVIIGVIQLLKIKLKENEMLVIFSLLIGIWVGLTTNNVNINRINIIYYAIMMLSVIGIYTAINKIKHARIIIPSMYMIVSIIFINTYFTSYANLISHSFYYGFKDALIDAEKTNAKHIYITADIQNKGNWKVSEILTLFYDKIDARYFQGKTNINNGKEYLPYKERYIYESISNELVERTENEETAYVIMKDDKKYFASNKFELTNYGDYYSVKKINS